MNARLWVRIVVSKEMNSSSHAFPHNAMRLLCNSSCRADPVCEGLSKVNNIRWALNIVKRYAIPVRKKVTGKTFLALVPYAHLMRHRRDDQRGASVQEGRPVPKKELELEYSMDNMIRLKVRPGSAFEAGEELRLDHSNFAMSNRSYSDAQTMIRYHHVSAAEEPNPNNFIRIVLPGCKDENDDLYSHIDHMDDWRKMLHLPLKLRELHEASQQLMLYGEEWVGTIIDAIFFSILPK